jgi:hypothetical protein
MILVGFDHFCWLGFLFRQYGSDVDLLHRGRLCRRRDPKGRERIRERERGREDKE